MNAALTVQVLRAAGGYDGTNGGVSSREGWLSVVGWVDDEGPDQRVHPFPDSLHLPGPRSNPPVVIRRRSVPMLSGRRLTSLELVPAVVNAEGGYDIEPGWHMFGGNFATASDSRWNEILHFLGPIGEAAVYAVPVFDRVE